MLNIRDFNHAGLLRDADAGVLCNAVGCKGRCAWDHAGLLRGVGACTLLGTVGSRGARESHRSGLEAIPRRNPAADAGLWALGAGREKLFVLRLVELDNERFDHLPLMVDMLEPDKFKMLKPLQLLDFDDGRTRLLHDDCSTSDGVY